MIKARAQSLIFVIAILCSPNQSLRIKASHTPLFVVVSALVEFFFLVILLKPQRLRALLDTLDNSKLPSIVDNGFQIRSFTYRSC